MFIDPEATPIGWKIGTKPHISGVWVCNPAWEHMSREELEHETPSFYAVAFDLARLMRSLAFAHDAGFDYTRHILHAINKHRLAFK